MDIQPYLFINENNCHEKYNSFICILMCTYTITAQVTTTYFESKDAFKLFSTLRQSKSQDFLTKRMPELDTEKLLKEDEENEGLDIPYRFGYGFDVNYTLEDGTWEELDSMRIWSMKFVSPSAYSLNFIFKELHLCPGARLYIFNTEGSMVYGPVTEKQNIEDGTFLTGLVIGDDLKNGIYYLHIYDGVNEKPEIRQIMVEH